LTHIEWRTRSAYRIRLLLRFADRPHNRAMPLGRLLGSAHSRARIHRREEGGQALIVVGLSIVVLLAALALGAEWGYGVTQRRVMQNAADGGALAGAKLLATTVLSTPSGIQFRVHQEDVYCTALEVANANRSFRPANQPETIAVSGSANKTTWTTFPQPTDATGNPAACPAPGHLVTVGTLIDVNPATVFVRVQADVTYRGLLGAATGQSSVTAGASAVARITGVAVATNGYTWPTMRHFNANDFQTPCQPPPVGCDPTQLPPVTFWSSTGSQRDIVFGNFKALIDFSRYSPNVNRNGAPVDKDNCTDTPDAGCVPQLMKDWDHSSAVAPFKPNIAGAPNACTPPAPSGKWFSGGNEKDQDYETTCSIPNWAAYSFSGSQGADSFGNGVVGLDTNWYKAPAAGGNLQPLQESPDAAFKTNSRSVCAALAGSPLLAVLPAPSCPNTPANAEKGDWIETAAKGDLGQNAASAMVAFIDAHPLYDDFQHVKSGPGNGAPEYGPHVVMNVYLWDCAESFTPSAPAGAQWSLALPRTGTDCSNIHQNNDTLATLDRVHVLTVVPFTFYRGLVSSQKIQGFWGGEATSDPGVCRTNPSAPGCVINPFANSVFLVSED
jgi:Flp pilus assembly protein TadG